MQTAIISLRLKKLFPNEDIIEECSAVHYRTDFTFKKVVDSYQGVAGGTGGEYYLLGFFIIICAFVFLSLITCLFFK